MNVRIVQDSDKQRWDDYVKSSHVALPQHQFDWRKVMHDTYGYDTHYLVAEDNARSAADPQIVGLMPLYVIKSMLVGRNVNTLPGGFLADSDEAAAALIAHAKAFAENEGANQLVVHDSRVEWPGNLETVCGHEAWVVDVQEGEDAVWSGLHRNIRRQIRMARKNKLEARIDREGQLLDDYYSVFAQFSHDAGTPVFGIDFLQNVIRCFPDGFNIVVIYLEDQPIAGYFQLELGDTVYGEWGAALREHFDLRPVYLAYWTILADTVERGFHYLDMGRAPLDSSASKYKGQWNGVSVPVYQQTIAIQGRKETASAATQAQEDSRFQLVRKVWPKLPYPVANRLGPMIRRHVPFA